LGLFIVRGDNIVIFGEVDDEKEASASLKQVTPEELRERMDSGAEEKTDWDLE
jgi:hypothetical protein